MALLKTLWRAHPALAILAVVLAPVLAYFLFCAILGTTLGLVMHVGIGLLILCIVFVAVQKLFLRR